MPDQFDASFRDCRSRPSITYQDFPIIATESICGDPTSVKLARSQETPTAPRTDKLFLLCLSSYHHIGGKYVGTLTYLHTYHLTTSYLQSEAGCVCLALPPPSCNCTCVCVLSISECGTIHAARAETLTSLLRLVSCVLLIIIIITYCQLRIISFLLKTCLCRTCLLDRTTHRFLQGEHCHRESLASRTRLPYLITTLPPHTLSY